MNNRQGYKKCPCCYGRLWADVIDAESFRVSVKACPRCGHKNGFDSSAAVFHEKTRRIDEAIKMTFMHQFTESIKKAQFSLEKFAEAAKNIPGISVQDFRGYKKHQD